MASVARPRSSSSISSCRWATVAPRSASVLRSSGLDSTVRANRNSSSSASPRLPASSAAIELRSHGLAFQRLGEDPPAGPPHRRPLGHHRDRGRGDLAAEQSLDEVAPALLRRARVRHRAPQGNRGVERVHNGEQVRRERVEIGGGRLTPDRVDDLAEQALLPPARLGPERRRGRRPSLRPGFESAGHGVPAGSDASSFSRSARKRSTVRCARASSSRDSPTIRLARVVARPPISLRSWAITWDRSASSWA